MSAEDRLAGVGEKLSELADRAVPSEGRQPKRAVKKSKQRRKTTVT
jgi:hypothetical protein